MSEEVKKFPEGFTKMLHELSERLGKTDSTLDKINCILTLNGRIPLEDGIDSLSELQLAVYDQLKENEEGVVFSESVDPTATGTWMTLGVKGYGRIIFTEHGSDGKYSYTAFEDGDLSFGYMLIPSDKFEAAFTLYLQRMAEQRPMMEVARAFMNARTQQELDAIVQNIHFICYHMAPVLYYTEEETITNFDHYNNFIQLMGGPSPTFLLDDLIGKPIAEWSVDQCLFIYSLHVLFLSGPPARGEEFNGKQVNPIRLESFITSKWEEYNTFTNDPQLAEEQAAFSSVDLIGKAGMLASARSRLFDQYTFYRRVNGLNLLKKESLYAKSDLNDTLDTLPDDVQKYFFHVHKLDVVRFGDLYPAVRELLIRSNGANAACMYPDIMSPLEEMVHVVVDSAVRHTKSDMGMSRSMRDFSELIRVHDNNLVVDACNWKLPDFFCCVVPSVSLVEALCDKCDKGPLLPGILKSVSIRMQYNSWHYTPGNFPHESVPEDRHFYFPPVMPDTAVWSDQHHRGHIYAAVRYSIRAPQHITYKGKRYNAFFDLRLMRQRGNGFTLEDMQQAVRYSMCLNQIYQAILDALAEGELTFKFKAFTKEWYDTNYGPNTIYKEEVYAV